MIGYRIRRPDCGDAWMFAGTTPEQLANVVTAEVCDISSADELGQIVIEAIEITQEEIDNMPEFPGW